MNNDILRNVKSIVETNITLIKKTDPKAASNIETFFNWVTGIPLIKLYTEEGKKEIEDKIYNTTGEYQIEVTEFLLRMKPIISNMEELNDVCYNFLLEDVILDKPYDTTNADNEFTKLEISREKMSKYYLLNVILAYNTSIL